VALEEPITEDVKDEVSEPTIEPTEPSVEPSTEDATTEQAAVEPTTEPAYPAIEPAAVTLDEHILTAKKIKSFKELLLDDRLVKAIAKVRWPKPTLVQAATVPLVKEGRDVIAKSSTGSGKTGAYALSALQLLLTQSPPLPFSVLVLVPTKTLAVQTTKVFQNLMKWCSQLSVVNVSSSTNMNTLKTALLRDPHIIVGTPKGALSVVTEGHLKLGDLALLIMDEADLQFSYGYSVDLSELRQHFPPVLQTVLMSATFTNDVKDLCIHLNNPVNLDLTAAQTKESKLEQYLVKCSGEDKFLLLYTLLKLNLLRGKNIIFVSDTNRCYRVKLFMEQFSLPSCVLNFELPANSVAHAIDQFNRGVYDTIITTDDKQNKDVNVSRGIDFQNVDNILNFDFPLDPQSYVHRVGRTARGFASGCSLSFITPSCEPKLAKLKTHLSKTAEQCNEFKPFNFNVTAIEGFRYRCIDAYRAVTKVAISEARRKEIKQEIINSEKLKTFFSENPKDLELLRHDKVIRPLEVKEHLSTVPDYLVPSALKGSVTQVRKRKRKQDVDYSTGKRFGNYKGQDSRKKRDPLQSFKYNKKGRDDENE